MSTCIEATRGRTSGRRALQPLQAIDPAKVDHANRGVFGEVSTISWSADPGP